MVVKRKGAKQELEVKAAVVVVNSKEKKVKRGLGLIAVEREGGEGKNEKSN